MKELITLNQINLDLNKDINIYDLFRLINKFKLSSLASCSYSNYNFKSECEFENFMDDLCGYSLIIYNFEIYDNTKNNVNTVMLDISYQELLKILKLENFL